MCICINCRHVHNCITYKFIQQQHNKYVVQNYESSFIPFQALIEVNMHSNAQYIKMEWDLAECLSFAEQPGYWLS